MTMKVAVTLALIFLSSISMAQNKTYDQITAVMKKQQQCWNAGDIEGYMSSYWESDELRFVGKSGVTMGWQATLDRYKKGYPTQADMGTLNFTIRSHEMLGKKKVLTLGQWELTYPEREPAGGWFTLLWEKIDGEWVIVLDHTS